MEKHANHGADDALRKAVVRTAALLRTVPDAGAAVPGLTWTIAETAAHLVAELQTYTDLITGRRNAADDARHGPDEDTPSGRTAAANTGQLSAFTERDPARLADMLVPAAEGFLAAGSRCPDGVAIATPNGLDMTVPTMITVLLGEQLVHGLDIARTVKAPWPIDRRDALLVIDGVMTMVPGYLDRERTAGRHLGYELRFRSGPRYRLAIDDGTAVVTEAGERVDCWISADPVAFLLLGYGRAAQWGQILKGKLVAGGRKPWLGLSFGRLITGP
ncbi:MAG: maleylpyruvate isomerase N-terminal domain-containing protein [Actinoallomurus sp.]